MEIEWHRAAPNPVALVFLPWENGVTIAKRDASGKLYGCRDVTSRPGSHFHACLAAWIETRGPLTIEDHAGVRGILQDVSVRLNDAAHVITGVPS